MVLVQMFEPKPKADDESPKEHEDTPEEVGGNNRPDPVRYGDWEIGGRCIDF